MPRLGPFSSADPALNFDQFRVLTFDVFGTLIDWESGIATALAPLAAGRDTPLARDQILEAHARLESEAQARTPAMRYSRILALVYRQLAEEWGTPATWDECLRYGESVADWPAFADSAQALERLSRHYKLAALSNVDNASLEGALPRLCTRFDAIFTAEDIGSYKPDQRNFDHMLHRLSAMGFERNTILHVAESLFHDHIPANRAGIANCWINRRHGQKGHGATMKPACMPPTLAEFPSMSAFADACLP